jgi:uncharacterized membrane protein
MIGLKRKKITVTDIILAVVIVLFGIFIYWFNVANPNDYLRYDNSTLGYERAKVNAITQQNLTEDPNVPGRYYGTQTINATFLSGDRAGQTAEVFNNLSTTHNVFLQEGDTFIACIDQPENVESYITVYQYNRTPALLIMGLLFLAVMVVIGRGKGVRSAIGLLFTCAVILGLMIPMIYHGYSPVITCILTVLVTTAVTLFLMNGTCSKTLCATLSTAAGVVFAGLVFCLFSVFLHISGFNTSDSEDLILISQSTGLRIQDILFASILIASLGAVMDTAMSIASSLSELHEHKPELNARQLFASGIHIGKDMIGTMSNTLILAFVGSCLTTVLAMFSYQLPFEQLMNSDFITLEVAQGLSGSIAVVLTVPISSLVCSYAYTKLKKVRGRKLPFPPAPVLSQEEKDLTHSL